jgi:catechol 2,3-dioxygenase
MAASGFTIDAQTQIGEVALVVADLERSVDFYTDVIGMTLLGRSPGEATLGGPEGKALLRLSEAPGAPPRPPRTTGLYHFAILVPSRRDLAIRLQRLAETRTRLQGAADHLVSEALYLADPDGNGIEIYRDRPREEWQWIGGRVQMDSLPVDFGNLLDEIGSADASAALPPGTVIGHVHLHVPNLREAVRFYCETLGLDLVAEMPGAAFLSAGGYHHHLGLNTWAGVNPPDARSAGLDYFEFLLPDTRSLHLLVQAARFKRARFDDDWDGILVRDPFGNRIVLRSAD